MMSRRLQVLLFLPLLAQASIYTTETTSFTYESREEDASDALCLDGCARRTLFGIIWSCALTVIICTWSTVHPNIPPQESGILSWLKGRLKRILIMLCTIVAPEILPVWALKQKVAASEVMNLYNSAENKKAQPADNSGQCARIKWTLRHAHFLIMGGFHLVEPPAPQNGGQAIRESSISRDLERGNTATVDTTNSGSVVILTFSILRELLKDGTLDFQINVTDDEIRDKSKGNTLSMMIFMVQTSWFVIQCLVRLILGLGVAQLELATAALASLNTITFFLWWKKPLNAEVPIRVYLSRPLKETEKRAGPDKDDRYEAYIPRFWKLIWINQSVLRRIGGLMLSPFILLLFLLLDLIFTTHISAEATHVPTFYAPNPTLQQRHVGIMVILAIIFGVPHIIGYPLTVFPTDIEKKLWLATSLAITLSPLAWPFVINTITLILRFIYKPKDQRQRDPRKWLPPTCIRTLFNGGRLLLQVSLTVTYVGARLILLGLALATLRRQPDNVYRVVDWTKVGWKDFLHWTIYFPHLSSQ